jgi:glutaminyl-tRNA synthetase
MNNFITRIIENDFKNKTTDKIVVRFPPEPNGYLHLGHAKAIIINSEIAKKFNGELNLRLDDTNPEKETEEYVNAIKNDAFWLVNNFNNVYWTSDYFEDIYLCAELLINKGLAYVDEHTPEEIKEMRGSFFEKGINSNYRNRTIEENLNLFNKMKSGEFEDGTKVLRAKIDMSHENINMRDPIIYRIRKVYHHNTKDKWCIYPMYDFAHPISDGLEGVTHSLCTLEFENHKVLYDWFIFNCKELLKNSPKEIEFSKLDVNGIILSKRKLNTFVENKNVSGWSDSCFPTISGLRNRGFTSEIITDFITKSGVSKVESSMDYESLNDSVRDILSPKVERTMAILNPIELELINFDEHFDKEEVIDIFLNPRDKTTGTRKIHLTKKVYIDEEDIRIAPEKGFWRVYKYNVIRLKYGYNILIKDIIVENNKPIKVIGELDFESKNMKLAKRKAKAAIHWLSEYDMDKMKIHYYENLVNDNGDFNKKAKTTSEVFIHKDIVDRNCHFEFERVGYFSLSNKEIHLLSYLKNKR